MLRCTANSCPDNAACVEFVASVPGCAYDDYGSPSRTARPMCMKTCGSTADCRQDEGYACSDPKLAPWDAVILDTNQSEHVCIIKSTLSSVGVASSDGAAQVCSPARPDASPLPLPTPAEAGGEGGDAQGEVEEAGLDAAGDDGTGSSDGGEAAADVSDELEDDATVGGETGAVDAPAGS
jgi:hypothetical protein